MSQPSAFQRFVRELRRRHVPQTAAVYLVAAWAAIEFADVVVPNLNGPQWVVTAVIVAALSGFPVVLVLAWVFDWGPDGLHRTATDPGRADDTVSDARRSGTPLIAVAAVLVVAIGSALAVAALLAGGGGAGNGAAEAPSDAPGRTSVDSEHPELRAPLPPDLDSLDRWIMQQVGGAERWRELGRLGALEGLRGLGGLDTLDASELADVARLVARESDLTVVLREPRQWRLAGSVPVRLAPGDTLRVEGVAVDSAGVRSVAVDGRIVAEQDELRELLSFSAAVAGEDEVGLRRLEIVVRTGDERTIRREYPIEQRPRGRP